MKYNFLLHRSSGKVGNIVAYHVLDKQVIRERVRVIANPRTDAQQFIRARLSKLSVLESAFHSAVMVGMKTAAKAAGMWPQNVFFQVNEAALTGSTPQSLGINPQNIQVSKGSALGVIFGDTVSVSDGVASIAIEENFADLPGASATDKVYAVVYCPDYNMAIMGAGVARTAARVQVPIPSVWSGMDVHFYGFTVRDSDGAASRSDYLGRKTLS